MGIRDVDRTLPSNRMVFELRRNPKRYADFKQDIEASMTHYGLSEAEKAAWRAQDLLALAALGLHPYFLPQTSRLFKGGQYNHNNSAAAQLYAQKMGLSNPS